MSQTGRIELFDAQGNRKYLNAQEREKFKEAAGNQEREVMTFCLMLYYTGCRISEALAVLDSRIDFTEQAVTFQTLKRRKVIYRQVPLPAQFLKELDLVHVIKKRRQRKRQKDERLWNWSRRTATRRVEEVMKAAGIEGIQGTAKGLRHGFAIACLEKGIPLNLVSKWLGHSKLETTAIYANALGQEERNIASRLWT